MKQWRKRRKWRKTATAGGENRLSSHISSKTAEGEGEKKATCSIFLNKTSRGRNIRQQYRKSSWRRKYGRISEPCMAKKTWPYIISVMLLWNIIHMLSIIEKRRKRRRRRHYRRKISSSKEAKAKRWKKKAGRISSRERKIYIKKRRRRKSRKAKTLWRKCHHLIIVARITWRKRKITCAVSGSIKSSASRISLLSIICFVSIAGSIVVAASAFPISIIIWKRRHALVI